jgi:asparagine synthetase B (glutamine-hydrolysing)
MGYNAALLSKNGETVSPALIEMLKAASSIRGDAYGAASDEGSIVAGSPEGLSRLLTGACIGHKLVKIEPNDPPQPVTQYSYSMAFEGRIWQREGAFHLSAITDIIAEDPAVGIRRLIQESNGSFAVTAMVSERILCGRDIIGVVPIYFGENDSLAGLASNRKMLWAVGLDAESVPPGNLVEISKRGVSLKPVRELSQPQVESMSMDKAVGRLDGLLLRAVETRCRGLSRVAIGLSGGIDSSLIAYYLDRCGVDVEPVCVGLEGSRDFGAAEEAADGLGLPLRAMSFTLKDVEEDLDDVLWGVEEPDPMKVGVALPLHWAAGIAAESGCRVFFSGSGSDELFGGYQRHAREYAESGDFVRESMFRDVAASYRVNYERDYKVCVDLGLELRLPFAEVDIVGFGLSLPVHLKLSKGADPSRKLVLRALAKEIGLPTRVVKARKRAVQYSTGANSALKLLARRRGRSLAGYLAERFERVREERLGGRG